MRPTPDPESGKLREQDLERVDRLTRKVDPPRDTEGRYRKGKKGARTQPRKHQVPE